MLKLFSYDNERESVVINEPDILLIKEFDDLWNNDRNKTKEDKKGTLHTRAFRELKYIYLAIDWRSPYNQYTEKEKIESARVDAQLTEDEFNDSVFRKACRKYRELLETSRVGSLLKALYDLIYRMLVYYSNLDLTKEKEDGSFAIKMKDVISEMSSMADALEGLKKLEAMWQKEQEGTSAVRGGQKPGFRDA